MDIDRMQIEIVHLKAFKKRYESLLPTLEEICKEYEAFKLSKDTDIDQGPLLPFPVK